MARARRAAVRALRRRAGVLLQLRRRGERGRDQVRAQGDRQAGDRRARGLVPRPHDSARSPRPASRRSARRSSRCSRASVRAAERHRVAGGGRRRRHRPDPARAGAGRGRRPSRRRRASSRAAAELAAEHGALLCFDEVQTGVGRTGSFFAFEQLGVRPHLVTLAKGLANGLPIGALLVADERRPALRARRPRLDLRRQSGRVRRRLRRRRDRRRRAARERRASGARRLAELPACRGARRGPAPRRRDRPARPPTSSPTASTRASSSPPPARPRLRLTPPLSSPHDEVDAGARRSSQEVLAMTAHRRERQGAILRLIREQPISTQAELSEALREAGFEVVQTTVSRDIYELGLVKVRAATAGSSTRRRAPPTSTGCASSTRAFRRWALSIEASGNLVVVFDASRLLRAALARRDRPARAIPTRRSRTIAGENTILVVPRRGRRRPPASRDELSTHTSGRRSSLTMSESTGDGRPRLLGRPRHDVHHRLAEGGLRLRRGRRRARRRRPGVRPRGVAGARQRGRRRRRPARRPARRVRGRRSARRR